MVKIFADSNRTRIRYAKEDDTQWGVVPTSGETRELRYTASTINATKDTTSSDEIRADRMVSNSIQTGAHASGDFSVEFSAGSHDDFLEGFSYGFWSRPMTFDFAKGITVSWSADNTLTIAGQDMSAVFKSGRRIRTDGFINAANNDYFTLASDASYDGTNTSITVSTTTSVIEAGSATAKLYDANDVIVIKSTALRCGTSGASTFDSNSTNAFSAAISAGQLLVGQNIFIDGLGYETGTVTFADHTTTPVSASTTVVVNDGSKSVTFQFGGTVPAANVSVSVGADETATATNLSAAINAQRVAGNLNVSAKSSAGVCSVKNLNATGGDLTKTGDSNTAITFSAFTGGNAAAHGVFTITSLSNDVIGVSPTPPTIANTTVAVTVKGSMLRNPNNAADITPHSFSFETGFEDVGQYFVTSGQRISTFSYDIASGSILKGQFGTMGTTMSNQQTTKFGDAGSYTVLPSLATDIANATVDIGAVSYNSVALTTALKSISIKGTNNLREQMAVANKFPAGIGAGRIEMTGTLEAYFADQIMWEHFINHDTGSLSFPLTDLDSNKYIWTFPSLKLDTDTVNPAGRDQDIMENLNFTAIRDPATNCVFQIDRFSCTLPVAAF